MPPILKLFLVAAKNFFAWKIINFPDENLSLMTDGEK